MEKIIYLLEDDKSICELIDTTLSLHGFNFTYFTTINQFESALVSNPPDIALIDIMLEDGNGLDVLKRIKANDSHIYCVMLSALSKELDKVKALNMGADDYITKPFGILELVAKLKAIIRRLNKDVSSHLQVNEVILNKETWQVTNNGTLLDITNREFKLLELFMTNIDKVLTRDKIMTYLWGYDAGEARTLDNYVTHLRKLGISNIETVYGVGYKFCRKVYD